MSEEVCVLTIYYHSTSLASVSVCMYVYCPLITTLPLYHLSAYVRATLTVSTDYYSTLVRISMYPNHLSEYPSTCVRVTLTAWGVPLYHHTPLSECTCTVHGLPLPPNEGRCVEWYIQTCTDTPTSEVGW